MVSGQLANTDCTDLYPSPNLEAGWASARFALSYSRTEGSTVKRFMGGFAFPRLD
jgi:hypothetical protein